MIKIGSTALNIALVVLLACSFKAQVAGNIIEGSWISMKPYYNQNMEITFRTKNSLFIERSIDSRSKIVLKIDTLHFSMIDDSTLIIIDRRLQHDTCRRLVFAGNNLMKFKPCDQKLREAIPLLYLFTFKKKD